MFVRSIRLFCSRSLIAAGVRDVERNFLAAAQQQHHRARRRVRLVFGRACHGIDRRMVEPVDRPARRKHDQDRSRILNSVGGIVVGVDAGHKELVPIAGIDEINRNRLGQLQRRPSGLGGLSEDFGRGREPVYREA